MVLGEVPFALERRDDRRHEELRERGERPSRVRYPDASSAPEYRSLRLDDHIGRPLDVLQVEGDVPPVGPHLDAVGEGHLHLFLLDVLREVYQDRTGSAGGGYVEGPLDRERAL